MNVEAATPTTGFFLGNSLTAASTGSDVLKNLAAARGIDLTYGWQVRYGGSLKYIYDNPHQANGVSGFGYWDTALPTYTWKAVTVQPWGDTLVEDKTAIAAMVNAARSNPGNANIRFYVFQSWCQEHAPTDYSIQWTRLYDRSEPNTPQRRVDSWTRDFSNELMTQLNAASFGLQAEVKRIPVGEVFFKLDQMAQNGQLPGVGGVEEWYLDPWHLNATGNYVATLTFFATLYAQDPSGLPTPVDVNVQLSPILQQAVWDVVSSDPFSGVPEPACLGFVPVVALVLRRGRRV